MKNILYFILLIGLFYSCGNDDCPDDAPDYLFEIPIDISPRKDTMRVGDTLTVFSSFSSEVFDRNSNQSFVLDDFNFYTGFLFNVVDRDPAIGIFTEDNLVIDTSYLKGITFHASGHTTLDIHFIQTMQEYNLIFKVVLRRKGLNFLFCSTLLSEQFIPAQEFPNKCKNREIGLYYKMGDETDNNVEFMNNAMGGWQQEKYTQEDKFKRIGGYCFYVVE